MSRRVRVATLGLLGVCLAAGCRNTPPPDSNEAAVRRGAALIDAYGCGACHAIPGIPSARGIVGPPLGDLGRQAYIAGVLANTPENLVAWIMNAPGIDPRTAMPNMGVGPEQAQDMAAYLYARARR